MVLWEPVLLSNRLTTSCSFGQNNVDASDFWQGPVGEVETDKYTILLIEFEGVGRIDIDLVVIVGGARLAVTGTKSPTLISGVSTSLNFSMSGCQMK
jgi:hypothetical protein